MALNSKKYVLFLKRLGFLFYVGDEAQRLNFEEKSVNNQEVQDQENLKKQIETFLKATNLKPAKLIILLSDEVYFKKNLTQQEPAARQKEIEDFIEQVPVDPTKIIKTLITAKNTKYAFATNGALYSTLCQIFKDLGWEIVSVIPILSLADKVDPSSTVLTPTDLNTVSKSEKLDNENLLQFALAAPNPVKTEKEDSIESRDASKKEENDNNDEPKSKFNLKLLILALCLFLTAGLIIAYAFGKLKLPTKTKVSEKASQTQENTLAETPASAAAVTKPKEELSVLILNASGLVGQAGSLKTTLTDNGYKNIETGNSDLKQETTSVYIATSVSNEIKESLLDSLKQIYTELEQKDGDSRGDIVILTGKLK